MHGPTAHLGVGCMRGAVCDALDAYKHSCADLAGACTDGHTSYYTAQPAVEAVTDVGEQREPAVAQHTQPTTRQQRRQGGQVCVVCVRVCVCVCVSVRVVYVCVGGERGLAHMWMCIMFLHAIVFSLHGA